jgi:hypothetical protein
MPARVPDRKFTPAKKAKHYPRCVPACTARASCGHFDPFPGLSSFSGGTLQLWQFVKFAGAREGMTWIYS